MGSVNSLSPNTVYRMRVEAMDNAVNVLSSAETEETTGNVTFIFGTLALMKRKKRKVNVILKFYIKYMQ